LATEGKTISYKLKLGFEARSGEENDLGLLTGGQCAGSATAKQHQWARKPR